MPVRGKNVSYMDLTPRLYASSFLGSLSGGRTRPCIFACEYSDGSPAGEYVVKLRHNLERGIDGLLAELFASKLASELGLPMPAPAIVYLDPRLSEGIVDISIAASVRQSAGLNFGSENLSGGYTIWQVGANIPPVLHQTALQTFIFDLLIENPDRIVTHRKPNILHRGSEVKLIDHELAFSFLLDIGIDDEPWELRRAPFAFDHVFRSGLRSLILDYSRIKDRLEAISQEVLDDIEFDIPCEWRFDILRKMKNHVLSKVAHIDVFLQRVREKLQ